MEEEHEVDRKNGEHSRLPSNGAGPGGASGPLASKTLHCMCRGVKAQATGGSGRARATAIRAFMADRSERRPCRQMARGDDPVPCRASFWPRSPSHEAGHLGHCLCAGPIILRQHQHQFAASTFYSSVVLLDLDFSGNFACPPYLTISSCLTMHTCTATSCCSPQCPGRSTTMMRCHFRLGA